MSLARYRLFAGYTAWANARINAAAEALSEADYRADRGAAFRSVEGTLNHLLVTDRLWLARLTGAPAPYDRLDIVIEPERPALLAARCAQDAALRACIDALGEADLMTDLRYMQVTVPVAVTQPLWSALDHIFNHHTHHRGQIHTILTGLGHAAPPLDLVYYLREPQVGMARLG